MNSPRDSTYSLHQRNDFDGLTVLRRSDSGVSSGYPHQIHPSTHSTPFHNLTMNGSGGEGELRSSLTSFLSSAPLLNLTAGFLDEEEEEEAGGLGGGGGMFEGYLEGNASTSSLGNESEYVWDEDDLLYRHSLHIAALLCFSYVLVFILGLVGNCFVIAVVLRTPRMRTPTNYFIVNLAMADVLVIVFCLPATLLSNIYYPWMLGWLMCKSVAYVQGVSVSASVNSLVAVSLDRFLAIWFPMKLQITTYRARTIIVLIWVMAVVSPIPYFVYFETNVFIQELPDLLVCVEMWPSREAEWLYFLIAHLLLCYLLPLVLISFCYFMIWIKVARRDIPGDTRDAAIQQMQQRSKVKVVKMLVVVVIIFMLSWLPLYVIFARIKLGEELGEREGAILAIVTPMAQWLGSSNSCINPILYAFFNKKYRNGFLAIIKSRSCCGTLRFDSYSYSTTRRSYYPSYRSTIRPEAATVDSISRHKSSGSNVYTLEGRAPPRSRYHHHHLPARPRLANGLAPALHLADNFTHDTNLDQKCGPAASTLLAGIEVVDVDSQEVCYEEGERVFPNGKLEAVD